MSVDIPNGALEIYAAAHLINADEVHRTDAGFDEVVQLLDQAARAAQVAILNQLSELLLEQRDKLTPADPLIAKRRLGLEEAAAMARSLAATVTPVSDDQHTGDGL